MLSLGQVRRLEEPCRDGTAGLEYHGLEIIFFLKFKIRGRGWWICGQEICGQILKTTFIEEKQKQSDI